MEYEFWEFEELEAKLRELHETHPEFCVTVRRVMDGGRFFVTVEQEEEDDEIISEHDEMKQMRSIR